MLSSCSVTAQGSSATGGSASAHESSSVSCVGVKSKHDAAVSVTQRGSSP
jgi:hypothetical protein